MTTPVRVTLIRMCAISLTAISVIMVLLVAANNMIERRTSQYVFEVSDTPRFLTEGMALDFGRKALALAGLNIAEWEATPDGRTMDPDGHTDRYVARSSVNPDRVSVVFRNKADGRARSVIIELQARRVVCYVTIPK